MSADRRGAWLLAVGVAAGAVIAAIGLMVGPDQALPPEAAALVNGRRIARADLERTMAALSAGRVTRVDEALERRVLERLVDEELLVQYAVELGLPERDPALRARLTGAVIALLVARSEDAAPPDDEALQAFWEANPERFRRAHRLRVRVASFEDGLAALTARAKLEAGATFEVATAEASAPLPVPAGAVPPSKLKDYLGGPLVDAALRRVAGECSEPLPSGSRHHLICVLERVDGEVRPLGEIREAVRAELLRKRGEDALRELLRSRRAEAELVFE